MDNHLKTHIGTTYWACSVQLLNNGNHLLGMFSSTYSKGVDSQYNGDKCQEVKGEHDDIVVLGSQRNVRINQTDEEVLEVLIKLGAGKRQCKMEMLLTL